MLQQIYWRFPRGSWQVAILQRVFSSCGIWIACCFVSVWPPAAFAAQQGKELPADSVAIPQELWDAVLREGVASQTPGDAERQLLWQASESRRLRLTSEQALRFKQLCMDLARNAWWRGDTDSARQLMQTADWHAENLLVSSQHESFMLLDHYLQTAFWELHFGTPAAALQRLQICVTLQQQSGAMSPGEFVDRLPLRQLLRLQTDQQFELLREVLFLEGLPRLEGLDFQLREPVPWPLLSVIQNEHRPLPAAGDSTGKALHPLIMCLEAAVTIGRAGELVELLTESARRGNAASGYVLCCLQVLQRQPISTDGLLTGGDSFPADGALLVLMWQQPGYTDQVLELLSMPALRERILARRGLAGVLRDLRQSNSAGPLMSEASADESWWGKAAGLISLGNGQVAADGSVHGGQICLPFPVAGDFTVQCDVVCAPGISAGLGYGGVGFGISSDSRTLRIRTAGNHPPLIRSTPFTEENILRRVSLRVNSGRTVGEVDGVESLNASVSSGFPWITLHAEGPWPAVWRDLSVSGDLQIPEWVDLSGDPYLRGWSSLESGQVQPSDSELHSRTVGIRRETRSIDEADWVCNGGVISGRPASAGGRESVGVLRFLRPLQAGDVLSVELFLAAPRQDCLLAVGEILVGITAEGLRTGWLAGSRRGRLLTGIGLTGKINGENTSLPVKRGWNTVVLRMKEEGFLVRINGVEAGEVKLQTGADTRFAVISPIGCQQTQVRTVLLSGDWPRSWPAVPLAGLAGVTEDTVGAVRRQQGLLQHFLSQAANVDLTRRLTGLPVDEQWRVLCVLADQFGLGPGILPGAGRWNRISQEYGVPLPRSLLEAFWELGRQQWETSEDVDNVCSAESVRLWRELRDFMEGDWSASTLQQQLAESATLAGRDRLARLLLLAEHGTLSSSAAARELLADQQFALGKVHLRGAGDENLRDQIVRERSDLLTSAIRKDQGEETRERLTAADDWIPIRTGSIRAYGRSLEVRPEMIWARTARSQVEAIRTAPQDILCWSKPIVGDCRLSFQMQYRRGSRPCLGLGSKGFLLTEDDTGSQAAEMLADRDTALQRGGNGEPEKLAVVDIVVQRRGNELQVHAGGRLLETMQTTAGVAHWFWLAALDRPPFTVRDWEFQQAETKPDWIQIDTGNHLSGWMNSQISPQAPEIQLVDGWDSEQSILTGRQRWEWHFQNWANEIRLMRPLPQAAIIRFSVFGSEDGNCCLLIGNVMLDIGNRMVEVAANGLPHGIRRMWLSAAANELSEIKLGQWNQIELDVQEQRVSVRVNGNDSGNLELGVSSERVFGLLQVGGRAAVRVNAIQIQAAW